MGPNATTTALDWALSLKLVRQFGDELLVNQWVHVLG